MPELEEFSFLDILDEFLRRMGEELQGQPGGGNLNDWGNLFAWSKKSIGIRMVSESGAESESWVIRKAISLLTTSPVSDLDLSLVTVSLKRTLEAKVFRMAQLEKKWQDSLAKKRLTARASITVNGSGTEAIKSLVVSSRRTLLTLTQAATSLFRLTDGIERQRLENNSVKRIEAQKIGRASCRERVCQYV